MNGDNIVNVSPYDSRALSDEGAPTKRIYFDYNASTPIAAEVQDVMRPYLGSAYGNPSSGHWAGRPAREAVEQARGRVADLLACSSTEVVFTSGDTEANNYALKGAFYSAGGRGYIVTTSIEHPAIIEPLRFLQPSAPR